MTNETFTKTRRAAEITSGELADFIGCQRKEMLLVESGRSQVQPWMVSALNEMMKRKGA